MVHTDNFQALDHDRTHTSWDCHACAWSVNACAGKITFLLYLSGLGTENAFAMSGDTWSNRTKYFLSIHIPSPSSISRSLSPLTNTLSAEQHRCISLFLSGSRLKGIRLNTYTTAIDSTPLQRCNRIFPASAFRVRQKYPSSYHFAPHPKPWYWKMKCNDGKNVYI